MMHLNKTRKKPSINRHGKYGNLGYLIWHKLPPQCFQDKGLGKLLNSHILPEDPYSNTINKVKLEVYNTISELKKRQIGRIRTGVSWTEWETPGGRAFIKWYIKQYGEAGFDILPNLTFTPPHLGINPAINSPPKKFGDYAIFVHEVCSTIGKWIEYIELWNEWNLNTDWDPELDPNFVIFVDMVSMASLVARYHGKKVVLGGMAGVRDQSLLCFRKIVQQGLMAFIDVIGFHDLRGTWGDKTPPPPLHLQADILSNESSMVPDTITVLHHISNIQNEAATLPETLRQIIISELSQIRIVQNLHKPAVWVTEYGFPPIGTGTEPKLDEAYLEEIQTAVFADALTHLGENRLHRIYWYTLFDGSLEYPSVRHVTTGWEDELQFHYGDMKRDGTPKLLARILIESGPEGVLQHVADRNLWDLVSKASLKRVLPSDYISQDRPR